MKRKMARLIPFRTGIGALSRMNSADIKLVLPLRAVRGVLHCAALRADRAVAVDRRRDEGPDRRELRQVLRRLLQLLASSGDTLVLGVKATLLCLLFGYPIAWICARAKARWQTVLVFLVILPIMTSVVVRTFSWIVILGRHGVLNQSLMGLGHHSRTAAAPVHRTRRRHGAGAGADAADGAADPDRDVEDRPEPRRRLTRAGGGRVAHAVEGNAAAVAARRFRRLHPHVHRRASPLS